MGKTPKLMSEKFECPHCNTLAMQDWINKDSLLQIIFQLNRHIFLSSRIGMQSYAQETIDEFLNLLESSMPKSFTSSFPDDIAIATCHACQKSTIWINEEIIFPRYLPVAQPNIDLNQDIQSLYIEAANIFNDSPKGATAILRLALQKLLMQVGKDGKNINNNIKELVAEGLSPKIQKALDSLRVVGNNAVHPGTINLDDNKEIALKLFQILNLIANELITKPKEIDEFYNDVVPDETKEHINTRDGRIN